MSGTWRSGRRPTPTATLKVVRGNVRIRGRRHEQEPQFQRGVPEPPSTVLTDSDALAHWHRLAETLDAAGIITRAHTGALALLAHAAADYDRTRAQLAKMNFQPLVVDEIRGTDGGVLRRRIRENPLHR